MSGGPHSRDQQHLVRSRPQQRRLRMLSTWERHRHLAGSLVSLLQQNGTAVALTAAVLGWTLFLWERARSGRLKRELSGAREEAAAAAAELAEAEPDLSSATEHVQTQSLLQRQLRQLKQEVAHALPPEPQPRVELVEEERRLMDLQEELEALSAELQQNCPSRGRGDPQWYTAALSNPSLSSSPNLAEHPAQLGAGSRGHSAAHQAPGSSGSTTRSTSRTPSMAGFQQRLRPLDVGGGKEQRAAAAAGGSGSGTPTSQGSPDVFHSLLERTRAGGEEDATSWLLDTTTARQQLQERQGRLPASGAGSIPVTAAAAMTKDSTPPTSVRYSLHLLGFPSPPSGGRRTAGSAQTHALMRRASSLPGSPRQAGEEQAAAAAAGRAAAPARANSSGSVPGSTTPLPAEEPAAAGLSVRLAVGLAARRESGAFSRTPSNLSDGRGPVASSAAAGTKIPKLPPSQAGTPTSAVTAAVGAAGPDFVIPSFRSSLDGLVPARASSPGCSPAAGGDGVSPAAAGSAARGPKQSYFTPAAALSKIPRPAGSSTPAQE